MQALPGGIMHRLVPRQHDEHPAEGSFDVGGEDEGSDEADAGAIDPLLARVRSKGPAAAPAAAAKLVSHNREPPPSIEVLYWGPLCFQVKGAWPAKSSAENWDPSSCPDSCRQVKLLETASKVCSVVALHSRAQQADKQGKPAEAMRLLNEALKLADVHKSRPDLAGLGNMHILRVRLHSSLLKACIDDGNSWEQALHSARWLVPVYQKVEALLITLYLVCGVKF